MTFLIARPKDKAELTLNEFSRNGLTGKIFPVVDINITQDPSFGIRLCQANPRCIIITSTYAAQWFIRLIEGNSALLDLSSVNIVCVGRSTAQLITPIAGADRVTIATPENSEGILQLDRLQLVESQDIVLLKGHGGRKLISQTLQKRKAKLTVLNVYERVANINAIEAFAFEQSQIKCIIATSVEITELLIATLEKTWLQSCQWIVASERIKDYAYRKGIEHITVSQGASSQALLNSANQLVNTGVFND
jgi:uroporphyrinogen-III synthase